MTRLFSIVIPTFERPESAVRAVRSALCQVLGDLEVILVDDGSAADYTRAFSTVVDDRVRFLRNPTNLGAAQSRNRGIEAARGRFITFLDDDDELDPEFLLATFRCLSNSSPRVALSWCQEVIVSGTPGSDPALGVRSRSFPLHYSDTRSLFEEFLSIGTGYGVTVTRECLGQLGGFRPELRTVEDTDFFIRYLASGRLPVVAPGARVTLHSNGDKRLSEAAMDGLNFEECRGLLRSHADFFSRHPSLAEQLRYHMQALVRRSPHLLPMGELTSPVNE